MNEIQKNIDNAYLLLSGMNVKGDGVDIMAMVREHLRTAYRLAKDDTDVGAEKETKNG